LRMKERGSEGSLRVEEREEIRHWSGAQETVRVEAVRDDVAERYGVVYQAKQSSSELLEAGGRSSHRSEKSNPQRDGAQILARREESKKTWRRTGTKSGGEN
jgi:hypothetical protein